ncbi:MAG: hypothetical protein EA370_06100 [Wenzhouxiangella sp.]|nr:MAG: hypothetical protein EA370_06100 [Wenzhouxiangella sp.]
MSKVGNHAFLAGFNPQKWGGQCALPTISGSFQVPYRKVLLLLLLTSVAPVISQAGQLNVSPCDFSLTVPSSIVEKSVVVFGELHGTKEAPFVFLSAICERLNRFDEETITVALEYPQVESEHLLSYVNSSGSHEDKGRLLETFFWKRQAQDGRTSVAMLELIDSLRRISTETGRLEVIAIVPEAGSGKHEELMAAAINQSVQQRPESPHFVLVGNLHSRRGVGRPGDPEFQPMLGWVEGDSVSVNIFSRHGDFWACTAEGCGRRSLSGEDAEFGTLSTAMPRLDSSSHHDYAIIFDRFSASPPAAGTEEDAGS